MGISVKSNSSARFPVPTMTEVEKYKQEGEWRVRNIGLTLANNEQLSKFCDSFESSCHKNLKEAASSYEEGRNPDQTALCNQIETFLKSYWKLKEKEAVAYTCISSYLSQREAKNLALTSRLTRTQVQRFKFSGEYHKDYLLDPGVRRLFKSEESPALGSMYCMEAKDLDQDQLRMIDKVIRLQLQNNFNGIPEGVARSHGISPRAALSDEALKTLLFHCLVKDDGKTLKALLNGRVSDPGFTLPLINDLPPEPAIEFVFEQTFSYPFKRDCMDTLAQWVKKERTPFDHYVTLFQGIARFGSAKTLNELTECSKFENLSNETFNQALRDATLTPCKVENLVTLLNTKRSISDPLFAILLDNTTKTNAPNRSKHLGQFYLLFHHEKFNSISTATFIQIVKNSLELRDSTLFRELFNHDRFNQIVDDQLIEVFTESALSENTEAFRIFLNSEKFSQIPSQSLGSAIPQPAQFDELIAGLNRTDHLEENLSALLASSRHEEISLESVSHAVNFVTRYGSIDTIRTLLNYERTRDFSTEMLDSILANIGMYRHPEEKFDLYLNTPHFQRNSPNGLGRFLRELSVALSDEDIACARKLINSERAQEIQPDCIEFSILNALQQIALFPNDVEDFVDVLSESSAFYQIDSEALEDVFELDVKTGNFEKICRHIRSGRFQDLSIDRISESFILAAGTGRHNIVDEIIKSWRYHEISDDTKRQAVEAARSHGYLDTCYSIEDSIQGHQRSCVIS